MKHGIVVHNAARIGKIQLLCRDYFTERGFVVTVSEIKPIAVLTDKITHAIDFLLENKKIREVNGAKRLLIGHNGEKYVIISEPEHLLAWELSEILVVPGAAKNPRYSEMYDLARTRIR